MQRIEQFQSHAGGLTNTNVKYTDAALLKAPNRGGRDFGFGPNRPWYCCGSAASEKHETRLTDAVKLSDNPRNLRSGCVVGASRSRPVGVAFRFDTPGIPGSNAPITGAIANRRAIPKDGTAPPECKFLRRSLWHDGAAPAARLGHPPQLTVYDVRRERRAPRPANSSDGSVRGSPHEAGHPADGRSASMSTTPCTDIVR